MKITRTHHNFLQALVVLPVALSRSTPSQAVSGKQFRLSNKLDAGLGPDSIPHRLVYNPLARLDSVDPDSVDSAFLSSESAYAQAEGMTLVSCSDPRVVSSSSWQLSRSPSCLLGTSKQTDPSLLPPSSPPPSLSLTFLGTGLDLFGSRSPLHGQASVTLDGRAVGTVDGFGKFKSRQRLWSVRGLPHGMHTVEVVATGGKQRRSGGLVVEVEGFGVVGLGGGGKQRVGSFAMRDVRAERAVLEEDNEWEVLD